MRTFAFFITWGTSVLSWSQARNNNWIFARDMWLTFGGDTLGWHASDYQPSLRNACISDPFGNFTMLVDDRGIHDALFNVIPGADSISLEWTEPSSSYVILPKPGGDPERYVVFRNEAAGTRRGCWVEVDLSANGGLGAVIGNTHWYTSNTTSKLVAGPHANGSDYWIVQHPDGTGMFESFRLSDDGLDETPVVSTAGGIFVTTTYPTTHPDFRGPMKMSVAGDRLALAKLQGSEPDTSVTEVFDFNPSSGEVLFSHRLNSTFWRFVQVPAFLYYPSRWIAGIEFSPEGSYLYVSAWDTLSPPARGNVCWQHNLNATTTESIQDSSTIVGGNGNGMNGMLNDPSGHQLQLAPNGRILGRQVSTDPNEFYPRIWVLQNLPVPTIPTGPSNDYSSIQVFESTGARGFPNFCKRYHDSEPIWLGTVPEAPARASLRVRPNPMIDSAVLDLSGQPVPDELVWLDALGRAVETISPHFDGPSLVLERTGLPDGLYTIAAFRKGRSIGQARVACQ